MFGEEEEANGGQDVEFSDMAELLGLETLDRLTSIMGDSNRD